MNTIKTARGVAISVAAMSAASARAATFITSTVPGRPDLAAISMTGDMVRGDATRLIQEWHKLPKGTKIVVTLNSSGGSAETGMLVGETIRIIGANTIAEGTCASSCAMAWLGGNRRMVDKNSFVGFHSTSIEINGVKTISQQGNAMWRSYLRSLVMGWMWPITSPRHLPMELLG